MEDGEHRSAVLKRVHAHPGESIVDLFRSAFPGHPVSRLDASLAAAFLEAYARSAWFCVARDPFTMREIGFAVGGEAPVLDRTRREFIRDHAWRIAVASLKSGSLLRAMLARLRTKQTPPPPVHVPFQIRLIAVSPEARGMGVGALLLEAFEQTLPSGSGYHAWTLAGEHGAEGFYRACGFECDAAIDGHLRMSKRLISKTAAQARRLRTQSQNSPR